MSFKNAVPARRFAGAIVLAAAAALPAHAGYHVTAFGHTAGFEQIMAADYSAAETALRAPLYESERYAAHANLCVTRLKLNERGEALSSCERAVTAAPTHLSSSVVSLHGRRRTILTHLYSNRGVARAVNGDSFGARQDFERALELDPHNENARLNLEHLAGPDLAQQ